MNYSEKELLRRELTRRLSKSDRAYMDESGRRIIERLIALPEYKGAKRIFSYYSVGREIDTHALIDKAKKDGKQVFIPAIISKGIMEFREYTGLNNLQMGKMNIPEPPESAETAAPELSDIIIVPGLAFDPSGARLGYGGGYYDRYLAYSNVFSIGLCRDLMLLSELPVESHDISVQCVLTETKSTRDPCRASRENG